MIKIISIVISAMAVVLVSFFSNPESEISLTPIVKPHLVPGEDCVVKIIVKKGTASGYGRLQQLLPQGLTAMAVETMGAQFEMEDNVIKFIWKDLPAENTFTISYKIHTDPNDMQKEIVPGSFFYSLNAQTIKVDMDPLVLDFSPVPVSTASAEVERKIFAITPEGGEYKVELTIHRKAGEHSARFIDQVPEGYTVTTISSSGAVFMFSNQQATFKWSQLPPDPIIKISYNLNAKNGQFGNPEVTGMLVYGSEGETQTTVASVSANIPGGEKNESIDKPAEQIAANLIAQENEKSAAQLSTAYIPAPQKGIFFKIQIAATRKSPVRNDVYFQRQYHLSQHVDLAEQDGWRKYMIGNFDSYQSANDYILRTRQIIPDAFVVAYRNAERIPIIEALTETTKAN